MKRTAPENWGAVRFLMPFILVSSGHPTPDMALRLILLQDLLYLEIEGSIKGGQTVLNVLVYGCR